MENVNKLELSHNFLRDVKNKETELGRLMTQQELDEYVTEKLVTMGAPRH